MPNRTTGIDFDDDARYSRRRAWRDFKKLFGRFGLLDVLAARFERIARTRGACGGWVMERCPRHMITAAMHHFASATPAERAEILRRHSQWIDSVDGKRPAQPWPEGDTTPNCPAMMKLWAKYGPPPGMPAAPAPAREYVEIGSEGRLYSVETVKGYPEDTDGQECRVLIDRTGQRLLISEHVAADERPAILTRVAAQLDNAA